MMDAIPILNMFPDYVPPEEIGSALSRAAIVAVDLDPQNKSVKVAAHAQTYIPMRLTERARRDIMALYELRSLDITITHPENQLTLVEPEELRSLFVERDSMTRGSLAGAKWTWQGTHLTISLPANGKAAIEKLIPQVEETLKVRFASPVSISVSDSDTLSAGISSFVSST